MLSGAGGFSRFQSDSGTKLLLSHSQVAVLLYVNVVIFSSGLNRCRPLTVPLKDRIVAEANPKRCV